MNRTLTRWILGIGLPAVVVVGAILARGRGPAEPTDTLHAEEQAEAESHAGEGDEVAVQLDSAALAMAGIRMAEAEAVSTNTLPVTGTITYDQNRVSHIGPKTEGRITTLHVDIGARVRRGQVLAVLESAEVGATRADLHEAAALLEIAKENYEREKRLEAQGISSRKELLDAEAELRRTQAAVQGARERLRVLGAGHGEGGEFAITAPFDGVVVEKHATLGEVADPSDQLFTVADLSRLWIELDIYERDLQRVAEGQAVRVTTAAYPGRVFPARIVYLGDILDPDKRTVRARVELENPDGALKPGMFATARIETGGGTTVVAVARDAVQNIESRQVVWVPGDEPGEFRARPVELGESLDGGRVQILAGLEAGEPVVVAGAFTLKSELSKGEFGGHGH